MIVVENTIIILLLILSIGLIIPELTRKFRLPFITILIIAGAIFGPFGLNYIQTNETINFLGFLGLTFLIFMAGLETSVSELKHEKKQIFWMSLFNGGLPFLTGLLITKAFGYDWFTSLLVGIVFISSSVAIIIPSLQESKLIKKPLSHLIIASVLVTDIASLVILGFVLQNVERVTDFPLPIYYLILAISIYLLFRLIPIISRYAIKKRFFEDKGYERKLRFVIVILIGSVAYLSILGVHPILAAFLTGLAISGVLIKTNPHYTLNSTH